MTAVVVGSLGELQAISTGYSTFFGAGPATGTTYYDNGYRDYAAIYRTQPWVRRCVSFLANNIATLRPQVAQIIDDDNQVIIRDHPLAQTFRNPNPYTTRNRLLRALITDMGVFDNSYWLVVEPDNQNPVLIRVPPQNVQVNGGLFPESYRMTFATRRFLVPAEQLIHFRGHNPESPLFGIAPIETLRRILSEEDASSTYREGLWRNGARHSGVIQRPLDAPEWGDTARKTFRSDLERLHTQTASSGRVMILEEGMTWQDASFTARDAQFIEARQLQRDEVIGLYHIPPTAVGVLGDATFSNVKELRDALWGETFPAWTDLIADELQLQLLPRFERFTDQFEVTFNLRAKLRGSVVDEAQAISTLVGAPVLKRNEGRVELGLGTLDDPEADQLVTPLNVLVGGQPAPAVPLDVPKEMRELLKDLDYEQLLERYKHRPKLLGTKGVTAGNKALETRHAEKWQGVLSRFFKSQQSAVQKLLNHDPTKADSHAAPVAFGDEIRSDKWTQKLADSLYQLNVATATVFAEKLAKNAGTQVDTDRMLAWLKNNAQQSAARINSTTADQVEAAATDGLDPDELKNIFETASTSRAAQIARSKVTTAANFGAHDAARQGGLREKTWQVNSANPRPSHADMAGETVQIDDTFSNGLRYPGDPAGSADDNAGCDCTLSYS